MITSEDKEYFVYGCITTIVVETLVCLFYKCYYETRCKERVISCFGNDKLPKTNTKKLLSKKHINFTGFFDNGSSISSSSSSSNDERFIDL